MAGETYQGWTNYETWAVSLWINQDEAMYRYLRLIAKLPQLGIDKDKALREWVEGMNPLTDGSMFGDLLGGAIGKVNWTEIMNAAMEG